MISWGILLGSRTDTKAAERVLQHSALPLDQRRRAYDHNRHLSGDDLVSADDLEIYVRERVADGVTLQLTGQHQVAGAVDVEGEHLVETVERKGVTHVARTHRYREGVHAVPVDNGRHPAFVS